MVAGRAALIPAGVGRGRARGGVVEVEEEEGKAWARGIEERWVELVGIDERAAACAAPARLDSSWRRSKRGEKRGWGCWEDKAEDGRHGRHRATASGRSPRVERARGRTGTVKIFFTPCI